jgi:hypothetical protein
MTKRTYKLVFRGETAEGKSRAAVKRTLASVFKAKNETVEGFFSGKPVVLKKNMDRNTALKYKAALDKAGAVCKIVEAADPAAETPSKAPESQKKTAGAKRTPGKPSPEAAAGKKAVSSTSPVAKSKAAAKSSKPRQTVSQDTPPPAEKEKPPEKKPKSLKVIKPQIGRGEVFYQPKPVNTLTPVKGGIDLNRKDMAPIPYRDIVFSAAVIDVEDGEQVKLLFFVRGYKRGFHIDAERIHYNEFPGVKSNVLLSSLSNLIKRFHRFHPQMAVDEATRDYLAGKKPRRLETGLLPFATAVTKELESENALEAAAVESTPAFSPEPEPEDEPALPEKPFVPIRPETETPKPAVAQAPAEGPKSTGRPMTAEYEGGIAEVAGNLFLAVNPFILPIGWALSRIGTWMSQTVTPTDGHKIQFEGDAEDSWHLPVLAAVPLVILQVYLTLSGGYSDIFMYMVGFGSLYKAIPHFTAIFIAASVTIFFLHALLKWFIEAFSFSWGGRAVFTAVFWELIAWAGAYLFVNWLFFRVSLWMIMKFRLTNRITGDIMTGLWLFLTGCIVSIFIYWLCRKTEVSTGEQHNWTAKPWDVGVRFVGAWLLAVLLTSPLRIIPAKNVGAVMVVSLVVFTMLAAGFVVIIAFFYRWAVENIRLE